MYTIEWIYTSCLLSQELKNLKAKIDCMTSCATHIRLFFTGSHEHRQFGRLHYPFRLHHKAQQLNPPFRTWSSPYSITTESNYYNHLEYCSLSFTISPKLRHRRVHVDGVGMHSNGWQSRVFLYSHQCLWVFYTAVYIVFLYGGLQFFAAKYVGLGVVTRCHSPGCVLADKPSDVFFWSRHRAVFFEGGKLHERVFLWRNLRVCIFWWWNLRERVFSHIIIFWHYACHIEVSTLWLLIFIWLDSSASQSSNKPTDRMVENIEDVQWNFTIRRRVK